MRHQAILSWLCVGALYAFPVASAQAAPAGRPLQRPAGARPTQSVTAPPAQAAARPAAVTPGDEPTLEQRKLPDRPGPALKVLSPVTGGLTADQVARRTLLSSATVRVKQAELDAAEAKVHETTYQFLPRLTFKASYTRLSPVAASLGGALVGTRNPGLLGVGPCPGGLPGQCVLDSAGSPAAAADFKIKTLENNYALAADIDVPLSDYILRLSHAAAASSASRTAARLNVRAEKLKVQNDGRVLFYNWLRAKGQVAVAQKSLEQTRARLKDARAAYSLGAISKADLMRLQALVANTELMVKQAGSLQQMTDAQLGIYMGDKNPHSYKVGEDVLAPIRSPVRGTLPALVKEAIARRLELRALDEASHALHSGSSATAAGSLPRLDAIGNITYANPNQLYFPPVQRWNTTWSLTLAATWTVGDTLVNSAAASELEAKARGVEAQRVALRDGIQQEVTADYLAREKAKVAITTSERAVAASAEAYRVATDLYRVGRATTTTLIDAESGLLQARLSRLNARIDLKVANTKLRHAVGGDVR